MIKFQSAPRAGARGDTSIPYFLTIGQEFQSAPRAGARGDRQGISRDGGSYCFNPLPARVRGEIFGDLQNRGPSMGFQSAPRAGARGDVYVRGYAADAKKFQSAPRAGARGDAGEQDVPQALG